MSIGRNYRLELEKRLRDINRAREHTLSLKILDEQSHLMRPTALADIKKRKLKGDEYGVKNVHKRTSPPGVVPLRVRSFVHRLQQVNIRGGGVYLDHLNLIL